MTAPALKRFPPLQSGDRLSMEDFESRYFAIPRVKKSDGLLKSDVFPGLWLDRNALLKGNMTAVLATLNRGTASPEHAAFVQQLATRRTPG